jgi:hypothetical protein
MVDLTLRVGPAVELNVTRLGVERKVSQIESAHGYRGTGSPVQHSSIGVDNYSVLPWIENIFAVQTDEAVRRQRNVKFIEISITSTKMLPIGNSTKSGKRMIS